MPSWPVPDSMVGDWTLELNRVSFVFADLVQGLKTPQSKSSRNQLRCPNAPMKAKGNRRTLIPSSVHRLMRPLDFQSQFEITVWNSYCLTVRNAKKTASLQTPMEMWICDSMLDKNMKAAIFAKRWHYVKPLQPWITVLPSQLPLAITHYGVFAHIALVYHKKNLHISAMDAASPDMAVSMCNGILQVPLVV